MRKKLHPLFLVTALAYCLSACAQPGRTGHLQCEHLINPLGIDCAVPRLSWNMADSKHGAAQTAYQIMVDTDSLKLVKGSATVWNTNKVVSDSILVSYKGQPLQSFTKYYWKVITWNEAGKQSAPSPVATFETAMMSATDWKGEWITDTNSIAYRPAPYFRKEINAAKKIASARAYIAAGGLYELSVNGHKVGDRMLDPMYTRFDRRTLYATLDITPYLQQGNNAIGVVLGNGWYNHQSTAVWWFHRVGWRNRPRFCANIRITYTDGSQETVVTDQSWKAGDGPIIFNSIYTAEHYDARKEIPGWDKAGFDASHWGPVKKVEAPSNLLVSQQLHPIRVVAQLKASKVDKKTDSCYVFHFPRNIAGVIKVKVKGKEGTTLRFEHAERLYKNGYVDMSNIDLHYRPTDDTDPFQTDILILSGKGEDEFSPKFNYKGFQYVEVRSSEPIVLTAENIVALEMHSDVPAVGSIHSSNPMINKLWEATNSSYLANLFGYPTDCPQREKNGWTGDGQIAVETGLYNFDGITVYEKWLADHRDEQRPDGVLSNIIPTSGWGYDWGNGPDWTSSLVIIPWQVYQFYGDSRLLYQTYDNIKRYVDHIDTTYPTGITDWGLGDWVPVKTRSSKPLTSSLYYYADALILSKAAVLFGRTEDAKHYAQLADKIRTAINDNFLNKETGIYCEGSQTELSTALFWGVVPDDMKAKVAYNLYKRVEADSFHLDVGLLGTKALLNALAENGYADAAYRVAAQETFPSWGWWIVNGATTLYENWPLDVEKNDASMNHIMFGEIGAWMYKTLGGIYPDERHPGFKNILLKPKFVQGLDAFEAKHQSPYGEIVSKWTRKGTQVVYEINIPANSEATVTLPKGKSATYSITPKQSVKVLEENNESVILQLKSGSYSAKIN